VSISYTTLTDLTPAKEALRHQTTRSAIPFSPQIVPIHEGIPCRGLPVILDLAPPRCHHGPVEKRKPHHDLAAFKKAFSTPDALRVTKTALMDAMRLGFTRAGMVEVIQSMKSKQFYKSMTALADHSTWQDVYHVPWDDKVLYVKFTGECVTGFLLLSFKEK